jgi:hypothetical protein
MSKQSKDKIKELATWMLDNPKKVTRSQGAAMDAMLRCHVLGDIDPFWVRWSYRAEYEMWKEIDGHNVVLKVDQGYRAKLPSWAGPVVVEIKKR